MGDQNFSLQNQTTLLFNESEPTNFTNYTNSDNEMLAEMYIHGIVWPTISSIGIVGNILSFVVIAKLANSSFYLCLACLALSDMAALVVGVTVFIVEMTGSVFESPVQIYCSAIEACLRTFSQLSSWITVAVTVDRYIAVCHPLKKNQYCTRKNALIIIGIELLVIVAVNIPIICLEWDDEYSSCVVPGFTQNYCFEYGYFIDLSVYVLIPLGLICVFNVFIIKGIYTSAITRRKMFSINENMANTDATKDSKMKTITILFTISTFFILSFLPFIGLSFYAIVLNKHWDEIREQFPIPFAITYIGSVLNHSINFLLYGLSGQRFREKFVEIFCFRRFV
ncbi:FMRFamide receptor-like [Ylistrum balloti]|uniref:FMRFamide receptor-like n=1 Tax=Ylistrum balloti TaxID=509963 RepID=UPI002905EEFB|nr:FMRFamide receptor-like [Ylistrum balloti]